MVSRRIAFNRLAMLVFLVMLSSLRSGSGAAAHPVQPSQPQAISPSHLSQELPTPTPGITPDSRPDLRPDLREKKSGPNAPDAGLPIANFALDQTAPAIAYSAAADSYLVVWQNPLINYTSIAARQVAVDGTPAATTYDITTSSKNSLAPDLATNSANGEYLVVWEQEYSTADHDIYARRVAGDGNPLGNEISISRDGAFESAPVVAYNATYNDYLVAWVYRAALGGDVYQLRIMGQRVGADGALIGDPTVIGSSPGDATAPDLAYSPLSQYYLLVWSGQDSGSDWDIYGQRLLYNGATAGSQIGIATWENNQLAPRLTYNPLQDEFAVVWQDYHWDLLYSQIYGQRVKPDGTLVGSALVPPGQSSHGNLNPDIAYQPFAQGYLVVWEYVYPANEADHDIYSSLFSGKGQSLSPEAIVTNSTALEAKPAVAADAADGVLFAWEDSRDYSTNGVDIYASREAVQLPVFSGTVFNGNAGDESTPLNGATVSLNCSNGANVVGTQLTATLTTSSGAFALPLRETCEYYNLVETNPDGFVSVTASGPSAGYKSADWLQFTPSLQGKTLSGNKFWDIPTPPIDTTPPDNWNGFTPGSWATTQTPHVSVHVEDTQSGLNVTSALYAYSINGGASYSPWQPASCSGSSGSQTVSADVPFGQDSGPGSANLVKFSIRDVAGNPGESPAYAVKIDTVPPLNPDYASSPTHLAGDWSNDPQVEVDWSGASDERSGLFGYSIRWTQTPDAIPDDARDTDTASITELAGADGDYWLHIRSVDVAGNAATGAYHAGPFRIDTQPPSAAYLGPTGSVNSTSFTVSWSGSDALSGVATYDVQTSPDGITWSDWKMGVTTTSASFTGQRSHNYHFRVRSRDQAGNLSLWYGSGPVHVGVDVNVLVRGMYGNPLEGAEVYIYNALAGTTNASGYITLHDIVLGDQLAADDWVNERYSNKGSHKNYSLASPAKDWSWREYWTNLKIPNSGIPEWYEVTETTNTQVLVLQRDRALVMVHMIVSVEWDATPQYLEELRQGLISASNYLYDVTDGQFVWGRIEVFDNKQNWGDADVRIVANQSLTANCNPGWNWRAMGGLAAGTDMQINMPGLYKGDMYSQKRAFRTFIHEFGHYGLWLGDEYLDRGGSYNPLTHCTTNFIDDPTPAEDAVQASIMYWQEQSSELCSRVDPNNPHNVNTFQDNWNNGEDSWETVLRHWSGANIDLVSPDMRGAIVPGPDKIPLDNWVKVDITDNDTGACPTFEVDYAYNQTNEPVIGMSVWLLRPSDDPLYLGQTGWVGEIQILGAHNGDSVLASKISWLPAAQATSSAAALVNCNISAPQAPAQAEQIASPSGPPITVQTDPFTLLASVSPLSTNTIELQVKASVALPSAPLAKIWQDGATGSISVPLTYDSGAQSYTGQAVLDLALNPSGTAEVQATDGAAHTVKSLVPFSIEQVTADQFTPYLRSPDGNFELMLPAGSLNADTSLTIQVAAAGPTQFNNLRQVSSAYQVIVSSGQYLLNGQAPINFVYLPELAANVDPATIQLYRWDAQASQWLPVGGGYVDQLRNLTSTKVDQLGVFALFGVQTGTQVYLPQVRK